MQENLLQMSYKNILHNVSNDIDFVFYMLIFFFVKTYSNFRRFDFLKIM
jgi:hypothetical protein